VRKIGVILPVRSGKEDLESWKNQLRYTYTLKTRKQANCSPRPNTTRRGSPSRLYWTHPAISSSALKMKQRRRTLAWGLQSAQTALTSMLPCKTTQSVGVHACIHRLLPLQPPLLPKDQRRTIHSRKGKRSRFRCPAGQQSRRAPEYWRPQDPRTLVGSSHCYPLHPAHLGERFNIDSRLPFGPITYA